jgi:hypothetical protein
MLTEALTALASTGGTALVTAMVTDGWEGVRARFARLLGHGGAAEAIEATEERLEKSKLTLEAASSAELEHIRTEQESVWRTRLEDLLERDPDAAESLRSLVAEVQAGLSGPTVRIEQRTLGYDHAQQAVLGNGVQNVTFGNQHGPDASQ